MLDGDAVGGLVLEYRCTLNRLIYIYRVSMLGARKKKCPVTPGVPARED